MPTVTEAQRCRSLISVKTAIALRAGVGRLGSAAIQTRGLSGM